MTALPLSDASSADTDTTVRAGVDALVAQPYRYGFVTDIETEKIAKGLSEDVVRLISAKKNEPAFLLEFRLRAFRLWQRMETPDWAAVSYPPIDYQDIVYWAAPRQQARKASLDEVDPVLLDTFDKLGIPLSEQKRLANVAVDAVFDSVSIATTYREKLAEHGVIFCSFGEAVAEHPELIERWLGSVVPIADNYFAALNSAVFSDGSFVFIPRGVTCPMDLSTYFRINSGDTGQFERTLIVAEEGASVTYLEGCTAPMFDTNQLHAAVVELVALDDASIRYSTVQNWYAGDENGKGASTTSSPSGASAKDPAATSAGPRSRPGLPSPGNTPVVCWWEKNRSENFTPWRSPTTVNRPTPAPRWSMSVPAPVPPSSARASVPATRAIATAVLCRWVPAPSAPATTASVIRC